MQNQKRAGLIRMICTAVLIYLSIRETGVWTGVIFVLLGINSELFAYALRKKENKQKED